MEDEADIITRLDQEYTTRYVKMLQESTVHVRTVPVRCLKNHTRQRSQADSNKQRLLELIEEVGFLRKYPIYGILSEKSCDAFGDIEKLEIEILTGGHRVAVIKEQQLQGKLMHAMPVVNILSRSESWSDSFLVLF